MEYLVDTKALLWWDTMPYRIGPEALAIFTDQRNTLFVSHGSTWELAIKIKLGKLRLPYELDRWVVESVQESGFTLFPIGLDAILATRNLEMHHGDPFDRLLISQAIAREWPVISFDAQWDSYPVKRIWQQA